MISFFKIIRSITGYKNKLFDITIVHVSDQIIFFLALSISTTV